MCRVMFYVIDMESCMFPPSWEVGMMTFVRRLPSGKVCPPLVQKFRTLLTVLWPGFVR